MRGRVVILVFLALTFAATAFYLTQSWMERQLAALQTAAPAAASTTEILVAANALSVGGFVKEEDMRWQAWPSEEAPPSYFVKGRVGESELVGAVVRSAIAVGEPITASRIVKPGDRGFLSAVLSPGLRAVSVPVTAASSNAGLIFPGDHVDVILTQKLPATGPEGRGRMFSETVLADIRILAMDQNLDAAPGKAQAARTATLEVTPKEAETVAVVQQLGTLSLSLRSLAVFEEEVTEARGRGNSHTWDTEASTVLKRLATALPQTGAVTVLRGGPAK